MRLSAVAVVICTLPAMTPTPLARPRAMVIRHDRADSLYLAFGARFPAVVTVGRAGDGTLIAPDWVLTAAHVAAGMDPARARVRVGATDYGIRRRVWHPEWRPLGPHDIGLVQLDAPVRDVAPLPLYGGDAEAGRVAVLVGNGDTRTGRGGPWSQDRRRRAATSRVDEAGAGRLVFRFDAPPGGTDLEGAPGRGDSGGPALLEEDGRYAVAGISSAGFDGEAGPGTYGAVDHYTRVSAYREWIAREMGQAPARSGSRTAPTPGTIAITNVAVIPMTRDTVLQLRTVIVTDGRIAAVGPARTTRVPAGARRIDGRGRYLIPGLADMHTHLFSDDAVPDAAAPAELGVILANGVTAARLMIGTPEHLALRRRLEAGEFPGPQLWIASPQLIGRPDQNAHTVRTAAEARAAVTASADAGYDFIKLTTDITPEVYDAVVAAAAQRGLPVVGHVDPRVGVARALAAGQHIEHLDNYLESALADTAPMRGSVSDVGLFQLRNWESLDHVDDARAARLAGAAARSGTFTTPTLNMFRTAFGEGQSDTALLARPDWQMMPAAWRAGYLRARDRWWSVPPSDVRRRRYVEVRNRIVKAVADSGGRIMAGSDSPEWFHVYGFALHRELESLVLAGLTPYQALAAATVNPAAFLGATAHWGTIEVGKRADLVLLAANPLADIRNTTRIEAVASGGHWLDRAALDGMLAAGTRALDGAGPAEVPPVPSPQGQAPQVVRVADNVYALIRPDPLSLAVNANSLVIVGDREVAVVDAQFTREATLQTLAAIRRITFRPVAWLVVTHWHDDHFAGTQVYADSFPGLRVVMHANTAADLRELGASNRAGTLTGAPPLTDRLDRLLAMGLGTDSTPVSPVERTAVTSALRIMRRYLAEAPQFREVAATDTVRDRFALPLAGARVEVRWLGPGNTRGDLVVHLPEAGVVATGDLVVAPVPFAFNAYPREWGGALDSVLALGARVVVPGHGPVMRDDAYVRTVRRMLGDVVVGAQAAVARGDSLRAAFAAITLEDDRRRIAGDEKWMIYMFRQFFLRPAVARAFEMARPAGSR